MSISHLIILGLFIFLGSVGLAMMQSALALVWRSSNPAKRNAAGNGSFKATSIARLNSGPKTAI